MWTCNNNNNNNTNGSFSEISEETDTILLVCAFLLSTIGISANLTVIIVFINCKIHRRSFTYLLVFQQSLIDMIVNCCYLIFFCVYRIVSEKSDDIYCKSCTLLLFFLSASTLNLVFIAVERYIAVVHPFKYWMRGDNTRSMLPQLCIPFIAAFLITFQYFFILEPDSLHPIKCTFCYKNVVFQILSGIILLLANMLCPICTMIFCYHRVYFTLMKQSKIRAELTTASYIVADSEMNISSTKSNQMDKAQKNFIITMSINTLVYVICIFPLPLLYLVYTICDCFDFSNHISSEIVIIIIVSNTVVNPFVYAFKFNDYKDGLYKTFCRQFDRTSSPPTSSALT
ncbi:pyroglutamylated RF-amide peptide receptor-like [Anneissia japonica]|uniref:pyroglutamylated RF-amide peptide receptor-like n=1 Tax=Anneissia japonica TaxID=1529436 RepID=UPI001425A75B|nr:pyroglutamylated RF-amide peptide receptor-like [Anneissia japonica]XP_033115725.1 pyroglutamylated RF-amide peptide receptor-like [Anneissia japonica]XP_033115726.1 pyroglutamylated RF-amide peptide receptor-like [Anneissia japonica]